MKLEFFLFVSLLVFIFALLFAYNEQISSYTNVDATKLYPGSNQTNQTREETTSDNEGRNMDTYRLTIHDRIVSGQLPLRLSVNTLDGYNGYGNKLYSMLTTFVVAILTDCAFVIREWPWIALYIKEPFNLTFGYNSSGLRERGESVNYTWIKDVQPWTTVKNLSALLNYQLPDESSLAGDAANNVTTRVYKYEYLNAHFMTICASPRYYEKLYAYGLVERATIDDAFDKVRAKEGGGGVSNGTKLESMLRVGFEVGGNLLRNHWQIKDHISERTERAYRRFFAGNYVIGMQMRKFFMNNESDLRVFFDCALAVTDKQQEDGRQVKWFVASDDMYYVNELNVKYPGRIIFHNETLVDHAETIMADIELLSRCDELIVTGGSTFGFVAAMITGRMPLYVNGRANMTECKRMQFSSLPYTLSNTTIYSTF